MRSGFDYGSIPTGSKNLGQQSQVNSKYAGKRLLIADDDTDMRLLLAEYFRRLGFQVEERESGQAALEAALANKFDCFIFDVSMPGMSGFDLLKRVRERSIQTPALFLTALDALSDKVAGFEAGADDYLAKPFSYDELLARVRALLRRSALRADQAMLKVGDLVMDPFSRDVRRGNREINLTQKEYALLEYLARHAGRAVTREQISQAVWKQEFDPTTNIVDVYINYVRKKVDVEGEQSLVQTVRGVGYMLSG